MPMKMFVDKDPYVLEREYQEWEAKTRIAMSNMRIRRPSDGALITPDLMIGNVQLTGVYYPPSLTGETPGGIEYVMTVIHNAPEVPDQKPDGITILKSIQ